MALTESALAGGRGATVRLEAGARDDEVLFGEGGGRMLLTVAGEDAAARIAALGEEAGVRVRRLGSVGGDRVTVGIGGREVSLGLERGPRGLRARPAGGAGVSHLDDDAPREECGVFGVVAPPGRDVSRLTFYALHALQHRGQESAGIAVSDEGHVTVQRDLGLV